MEESSHVPVQGFSWPLVLVANSYPKEEKKTSSLFVWLNFIKSQIWTSGSNSVRQLVIINKSQFQARPGGGFLLVEESGFIAKQGFSWPLVLISSLWQLWMTGGNSVRQLNTFGHCFKPDSISF